MIILQVYNKRTTEFEVLYNDEYFELNPPGIISREKLLELCALAELKEIIVLPQQKTLSQTSLFICSEGIKKNLELVHSDLANKIVELPGKIDGFGKVQIDLTESEINIVLRQVYNRKPGQVTICLSNAILNPSHEKSLSNLIKGAGYKVIRSFDSFHIVVSKKK